MGRQIAFPVGLQTAPDDSLGGPSDQRPDGILVIDCPHEFETLRRALETGPPSVETHTGLGRALAGQNRMPEAVNLGRRVVRMTREQNPRMLGVLAAAQAATGDFDRAVTTVRKAIRLAAIHPGNRLERLLQERLDLYHERKPYVER